MGKGRQESFIHSVNFIKPLKSRASGSKYNMVPILNHTSVFECDTMNRCYFCNGKIMLNEDFLKRMSELV